MMTHNIYNLLESESEREVDRLAVVEHRSLQAVKGKERSIFVLFLNYKNIKNVERVIFKVFTDYNLASDSQPVITRFCDQVVQQFSFLGPAHSRT